MSKNIYVIKLENEKYFVYCTDTEKEENIILECILIFEFVQKYKPISIIETIWSIDLFDIDKTVKKYMIKYGIDNVRGGSYKKEFLSCEQNDILQVELNYIHDYYKYFTDCYYDNIVCKQQLENNTNSVTFFSEQSLRHFIYVLLQYSKDELLEFQKKCEKELIKYRITKQKKEEIENIIIENKNYKLDKNIIKNINDLQKYVFSYILNNKDEKQFDKDIYKSLLIHFKHFTKIIKNNHRNIEDFYKTIENSKNDINNIFYLFPEFLFDDIVLIPKYSKNKYFLNTNNDYENKTNSKYNEKLYNAYTICSTYEGIAHWCFNRLDEYNFDLKNFPKNIEQRCLIIDYFIKNQEGLPVNK